MIFIIKKRNKNYLFQNVNFFFLIGLCFFIQINIVFAYNSKEDDLSENLSKILSLQDLIQKNINLYTTTRSKLINKKNTINQEIINKKKQLNKKKISISKQNVLLKLDLKLIRQLKAYISQLTIKIILLQNCNSRLSFLYDQTDDVFILIQNINNFHINEMAASMETTLQEEILSIEILLEKKPKKIWYNF